MANEREKRRASGLIVLGDLPGREKDKPFVCRVHTLEGPCGRRFENPDELIAHSESCVKRNEDLRNANSPRLRMPMQFDREFWDPELEVHYKRLGERMEKEGRVVPRPNERAGGE